MEEKCQELMQGERGEQGVQRCQTPVVFGFPSLALCYVCKEVLPFGIWFQGIHLLSFRKFFCEKKTMCKFYWTVADEKRLMCSDSFYINSENKISVAFSNFLEVDC